MPKKILRQKDKKGFVISWFYPPINSSEGLVTYKLLNRSSRTYDVFTQNESEHWSYKTNETKLIAPNVATIKGDGSSYEAWQKSCLEYFDKHYKEYSFIMSRSMPPESHQIALAVKEKYPNMPWIASFGDPIYNSPYTKLTKPTLDLGPGPSNPLHPHYYLSKAKRFTKRQLWKYRTRHHFKDEDLSRKLEYATLNNADIVIFNNTHQRAFMLQQHNLELDENKHIIVNHPFEESFYATSRSKNAKNDRKIVLSHIGHLDLIRTPKNLLKAVVRLRDSHPELYERLSLNFYGNLDDESKIYIIDNSLFDNVVAHKPVSYFESLATMQQADWCILIDANISTQCDNNIYCAAKLADYLGSRSPIFAITMLDGASADILRSTKGSAISSHSVDEIYMNLLSILLDDKQYKFNTTEVAKFNAKSTAKIFDDIVARLLA